MPAQLQGITPSIADKLRAAGVHGLAKLLFLDAYNLEGITVRTADANVWVTTLKYCACVRDVCRVTSWVYVPHASGSAQGKKPPFGAEIAGQLAGVTVLRPTAVVESGSTGRELRIDVAAGASSRSTGEHAAGASDWQLVVAGRGPQALITSRM